MNPGDTVRVLPDSGYRRAGQTGAIAAHHIVLADWIFVKFGKNKLTELIDCHSLQLIKGEQHGDVA